MRRPALCAGSPTTTTSTWPAPVLRQAKLDHSDLEQIAETKSQAHLLALSLRQEIDAALADMLVARGNREVVCSIATNENAHLSEDAFTTLVQRAEQDSELSQKLSLRTDIPPHLFQQLLIRGSDLVQKRLFGAGRAGTADEIGPYWRTSEAPPTRTRHASDHATARGGRACAARGP